MAKKKHTHPKPKPKLLGAPISQRALQNNYNIIKKFLRHLELDPDILDAFTKKQRYDLLYHTFNMPQVRAEAENTIPRQYMTVFKNEIALFLRNNYIGNPENKLSYMEVATHVFSFLYSLRGILEDGSFAGTPQEALAQSMMDAFKTKYPTGFKMIFEVLLSPVYVFIEFLLKRYSQINFRQYGFKDGFATMTPANPGMKILITVENCREKFFNINGIHRKAFQLFNAPHGLLDRYDAVVPKKWITPSAKDDQNFTIWMQSHVLHRFKERMDVFRATERNLLMQHTLTNALAVRGEKQKFLACNARGSDNRFYPIGYFSFLLMGDDLVIKTFLPLISPDTPEGERFLKIIPLSKEEMSYIGMDKISFFLMIDFEQIPLLKQAMIESGIWQSVEALHNLVYVSEEQDGEPEDPISESSTAFVKHFFDKLEQQKTVETEWEE
jgi:hypothetical protein